MNCQTCGRPTGLSNSYDGPGAGICNACFKQAINRLCAIIKAAPPDAVSRVYVHGMLALGASDEDILEPNSW